MFINKYPVFKKGNVLEKEDLDLLRDNPLEVLSLMYSDKSNGIIKGFDLIPNYSERIVIITKGMAKCNGELFWMKEDYIFDMPKQEERYILKLKLVSDIEERKYYVREGRFVLELGENINEDEIEITRFITREGAELRNDYQNFRDLRRDFNLMEIINTKYSSAHEWGTFHPHVLKLWGKEVSKKENLDIFDINFYVTCLQQDVIERDVITSYINAKLNLTDENYTNEQMFRHLLTILDNLGTERKKVEKKRIIPRKIIVE